ncbi:MAG: hypothetical protein HN926_09360 [Chloroflexi bacterium]|jgi:hypothetical protein|nr:hypothetical protein [Chloroflexota bacterium]MBT7468019.1 hypothetical protein [Chloroflexota bacterium]MBT7833019.1 hypothetical protein [Chloroflexota bacterium]
MIHEFRTYDLKPGSLAQYYKNTAPMMEKRLEYSSLVGYFHTEIGPLNRVLHIWEYEDLNERTDVRSKVIADGIWPPPNKGIVENQQVDIFMPAPFMPSFERERAIGPLFELRMYRYPVGAITKVYEAWTPKIEARMKLAQPVGIWSSDIGGANQLAHMWAYESFEHRMEARKQFASIGWPPDSGVMPITMQNMIMLAADFSPVQ